MARRDIVVIGASAGGVEALKSLVAELPAGLPAAVFVVLHVPPRSSSLLDIILARAGTIPVRQASDGARIEPGCVYVAVPDRHLMLESDVIRVTKGPRENRSRPAVDVLFRSAAYAFGPRVVGVVLSGGLDDGTAGLWQIKDRGGIAIVQAPETALHPSMPKSALEYVEVDHCVSPNEIGQLVGDLAGRELAFSGGKGEDSLIEIENHIALGEDPLRASTTQLGPASTYTCPECHGAMVEITQHPVRRYRCHTGHAFSEQSLLAYLDEQIDGYLWNTLRTVDERVMLLHRMEQEFRTKQAPEQVNGLRAEIERANSLREQLRRALAIGYA
jgi:two-component system, chemotaxis family, protein-glutamate methylesterase/glutaminase